MANKKISELPAAGTLTGLELVEVVDGGINSQTTAQAIADLGGGGGHVIEDEGTPLTQRTKLNFVGAGVAVTDDSGDDATVVTIAGGGTPGGSDTQVQFNDGGSFGGDAGMTYNKTTNTLTIEEITNDQHELAYTTSMFNYSQK